MGREIDTQTDYHRASTERGPNYFPWGSSDGPLNDHPNKVCPGFKETENLLLVYYHDKSLF